MTRDLDDWSQVSIAKKIGLAITAALIGVGFLEIVALLVLGVRCLLSCG